MKEKVNIFYGTDYSKLENDINSWLKEFNIDILRVVQSIENSILFITIFYFETHI